MTKGKVVVALGVASMVDKMREVRFRCFEHVKSKCRHTNDKE